MFEWLTLGGLTILVWLQADAWMDRRALRREVAALDAEWRDLMAAIEEPPAGPWGNFRVVDGGRK